MDFTKEQLIDRLGITFEKDIVDADDFENSVELDAPQELLNSLNQNKEEVHHGEE